MKNWKWKGLAGHFCCARRCLFTLCTDIGGYRISTVGAYYPNDGSTEMETIGCQRHYETFVFEIDQYGKIKDYCEIDSDGIEKLPSDDPYATDMKAEEMHMKMCFKYDNIVNEELEK